MRLRRSVRNIGARIPAFQAGIRTPRGRTWWTPRAVMGRETRVGGEGRAREVGGGARCVGGSRRLVRGFLCAVRRALQCGLHVVLTPECVSWRLRGHSRPRESPGRERREADTSCGRAASVCRPERPGYGRRWCALTGRLSSERGRVALVPRRSRAGGRVGGAGLSDAPTERTKSARWGNDDPAPPTRLPAKASPAGHPVRPRRAPGPPAAARTRDGSLEFRERKRGFTGPRDGVQGAPVRERSGPVAQLVEQGTLNPWVVGSIPTGLTKISKRSAAWCHWPFCFGSQSRRGRVGPCSAHFGRYFSG